MSRRSPSASGVGRYILNAALAAFLAAPASCHLVLPYSSSDSGAAERIVRLDAVPAEPGGGVLDRSSPKPDGGTPKLDGATKLEAASTPDGPVCGNWSAWSPCTSTLKEPCAASCTTKSLTCVPTGADVVCTCYDGPTQLGSTDYAKGSTDPCVDYCMKSYKTVCNL